MPLARSVAAQLCTHLEHELVVTLVASVILRLAEEFAYNQSMRRDMRQIIGRNVSIGALAALRREALGQRCATYVTAERCAVAHGESM